MTLADFGAVEEAVGDDVEDLAGLARRTRARWTAWSPVREAVVAVQVSAIKRRRVMIQFEFSWQGDRVLPGLLELAEAVGDGFAGAADENLLLALVVEVDVEDGGAAVVPDVLGDGEVEEDHAFGGLAGADHGFAEERLGGDGLEVGEGGVDVGEIVLFDGAGGDLFAVGGGEGGGEVLEEEREVEAVVDAEGGEDVEFVLGVLVGRRRWSRI